MKRIVKNVSPNTLNSISFSLIICTYQRPRALKALLNSVIQQELYPKQVLIIDGSFDNQTQKFIRNNSYNNLEYYKVDSDQRGLTKQRNFGVKKVCSATDVICFLDDDIILTPDYFKNLIESYSIFPDAVGVGGFILDEAKWEKIGSKSVKFDEYEIDGYKRKLGRRNKFRKKLGLLSDRPPGYFPDFSHGLSISFLPPTGKIYPVEFFMGGVASYKKALFKEIGFSSFFEGYGLYEDMDFCLRASKFGPLYVNTSAKLYHNHEGEGRPNQFKYGKMVVRNGWYVWRLNNINPSLKIRVKWHRITFFLIIVRLLNIINTNKRRKAFTECLGRIVGWLSILFNPPKVNN